MNFLAHCLIGDRAAREDRDALVAGGFLGDFVKGPLPPAMPDDLSLGVRLHRRVDAYSNQHPIIRDSVARFPTELRRIAPILVDILCDHFLSSHWDEFHPTSLPRFTRKVYVDVASFEPWLPGAGHRFLTYARERDLLARYADWTVALGAMRSITRRLGLGELDAGMEAAVPPLLGDLDEDFRAYFPDIVDHACAWADEARRSGGQDSARS
ncbi:MAG: ACP phosphodiesterase [Pseudomonadales bacterium]|jgi:acyl carrier protein phosphodiesterase